MHHHSVSRDRPRVGRCSHLAHGSRGTFPPLTSGVGGTQRAWPRLRNLSCHEPGCSGCGTQQQNSRSFPRPRPRRRHHDRGVAPSLPPSFLRPFLCFLYRNVPCQTTACREDGTVAPGAPLAGSKLRHRGARAVPSPPPLPAPPAPGTPRRCRGMFLSCSTQQRRTRPRFRGLTVRAGTSWTVLPASGRRQLPASLARLAVARGALVPRAASGAGWLRRAPTVAGSRASRWRARARPSEQVLSSLRLPLVHGVAFAKMSHAATPESMWEGGDMCEDSEMGSKLRRAHPQTQATILPSPPTPATRAQFHFPAPESAPLPS